MSKATRVVHAIRSDGFAGVEQHVARLAAAQAQAGLQVRVIGGDPAGMGSVLRPLGVRHRGASTLGETTLALNHWADADVVHVHMTAAEAAAALAWRTWGTPVVATRHFGVRRGAQPVSRMAAPLLAHRISAQVAISQYVADRCEGTAVVIYAGVDDAVHCSAAGEREPIVLVAQRLEAEKATDVAIQAFRETGLEKEGWRLQIAGDGADLPALKGKAGELGPSVEFLGRRNDVDALMRRASILLAPCPIEGLGLTVLEAMARRLPVVAAAAGGHLETVGLAPDAALFAVGDTAAAAARLVELAGDADHRDVYGADLQRLQRSRFTMATQVEGIGAVYRSVLT